VVASIDAKRDGDRWAVRTRGGRSGTTLDAVQWARECAERGAGEILLTSIDRDGVRSGYDIELTRAVSRTVSVPVVASGGAGTLEHFREAFAEGDASGALAASLFHFGTYTIEEVKAYLAERGVEVRR
jgi:cyclase